MNADTHGCTQTHPDKRIQMQDKLRQCVGECNLKLHPDVRSLFRDSGLHCKAQIVSSDDEQLSLAVYVEQLPVFESRFDGSSVFRRELKLS